MAWNIPCLFISLLHNKDIICYFTSLLVSSGHFQFTSTISVTVLLVELVTIKHGHHVCSFMLTLATSRECFSYFGAMPQTLFEASKITSIKRISLFHLVL